MGLFGRGKRFKRLYITTTNSGLFDGVVTKATGLTPTWWYGSLSKGTTANPSYTFTTGASKRVIGSFDDPSLVTALFIIDESVTGTVDVSDFTGSLEFDFATNAGLTGFTLPTSSAAVTRLAVNDTAITSLDLSVLSDLSGTVKLNGISALTSLTLGSSTAAMTIFYAYDCTGLTGTLDLSGYTGLKSDLRVYGCSGVTSITFPTNSQTFSQLRGQNCNITGTLDLSPLTGQQGQVYFSGNSLLTAVTFPTTTATFDRLDFQNCNITGTVDLSTWSNGGNDYLFGGNSLLTGATMPASSSEAIGRLEFNGCNLTGTFDASGLSALGGTVYLYDNTLLTAITACTSSATINNYRAYNTGITTLDLSGLTGLGGTIYLRANSSLTSITWPTSSVATSIIYGYDCDITGTLDISGMTGLAGVVRFYGNANMTSMTLPSTSSVVTDFRAYSCDMGYIDIPAKFTATNDDIYIDLKDNSMTAAEVNNYLTDLDATGWIDGTILIGGTNAAPDTTSGGNDGDAAVTALIADGWTVSTS